MGVYDDLLGALNSDGAARIADKLEIEFLFSAENTDWTDSTYSFLSLLGRAGLKPASLVTANS